MPYYETLQKISTNLQTALLHSRADFLLQQTKLWQEINKVDKGGNIFVQPASFDIAHSKFDFYIAPKNTNFLIRFYRSLFKLPKTISLFKLCSKDDENAIKVSIEIKLDADQQLKPKISSEPEITSNPDKTYVTGISF